MNVCFSLLLVMGDLNLWDNLGVKMFLEGQLHNLKYYLKNLQITVRMAISLRSICLSCHCLQLFSEYTEKLECRWAPVLYGTRHN